MTPSKRDDYRGVIQIKNPGIVIYPVVLKPIITSITGRILLLFLISKNNWLLSSEGLDYAKNYCLFGFKNGCSIRATGKLALILFCKVNTAAPLFL